MYIGWCSQPLEGVVSINNPNVCTLIGYCIGHVGINGQHATKDGSIKQKSCWCNA